MQNFVQEGKYLDYINTTGVAILSDAFVPVGALNTAATGDIAAAATGSVALEGVFALPKLAATAMTAGQKAFWNGAAVTNVRTNRFIGWIATTVGAAAATVEVLLGQADADDWDGILLALGAPALVGDILVVDDLIGVVEVAGGAGDIVPVSFSGVYSLPKLAATPMTTGQKAFWNGATVTNVRTNIFIGWITAPALAGDASVVVRLGQADADDWDGALLTLGALTAIGDVVVNAELLGVAEGAGDLGDIVPVSFSGVYTLPKAAVVTAIGEPLFWDGVAGNVTNVAAALLPIGHALSVQAGGDPTVLVRVSQLTRDTF